jgi:hypothetical protein
LAIFSYLGASQASRLYMLMISSRQSVSSHPQSFALDGSRSIVLVALSNGQEDGETRRPGDREKTGK